MLPTSTHALYAPGRQLLPSEQPGPRLHQHEHHASTATSRRPEQRPHGGDRIDRSSPTPPSARLAATHGATVGLSRILIRPTTGRLTSPCSSLDARGQRGRHRRATKVHDVCWNAMRSVWLQSFFGGEDGMLPLSSLSKPSALSDRRHHGRSSSAAPALLHCGATRRRARLGDAGGQ